MTPSEIRALISSNLADNSAITAVKHRAVENELINYSEGVSTQVEALSTAFLATLPKNIGWVGNFNPGSSTTLTFGGNVTNAVIANVAESIISVTVLNAMPSMNYLVKGYVESMGGLSEDNTVGAVVFKKISTSQFQISTGEFDNENQNLKIHLEVKSLD
ncbi:hypothetical protein [Flavobacterium sp.]|uniref:hypothetical protein n=1 Tax=Flavobacterium sp. TaxID=239 RepID=UPI0025CF3E23|nr:hypothetical protein [Flavobacterium sp.]